MITPLAADSPSWTDRGAFWVAVAAVLIAAGALAVSWFYGRRSANAAARSADKAEESARSAAQVARAEMDRDHRANAPKRDGWFVSRDGNLYYEFHIAQPYMFAAWASGHGGAVVNDLHPGGLIDGPTRVFLGYWQKDRLSEPWDTLTLKFWPPEETTDGPAPWSCPCGLPEAMSGGPGHWQFKVSVPQDRADITTFDS